MAGTTYEDLVSFFKEHNRIKSIAEHSQKVHSVGWNVDGRKLASGSLDKKVCLLNLTETKLEHDHEFKGHTDQVDQLCWHKTDPDLLASASGDKTVRIWDARVKKCVHVVPTKGENINIAFSPDGNTIAVGNKNDLISFIDTRTFKIINNEQFKSETNEFSWNFNNTLFFVVNMIGQIIVMSWPELKTLLVIPAHPSNNLCIEFSPNGKYFAVGTTDAIVTIWDARNLVCVKSIGRLDWSVRAVSFSHDSKILAAGSEDLSIDIAYVETGERIHEIKTDSSTFTLAWHPKRRLLAFAGEDKSSAGNGSYGRSEKEGIIKLFGLPSVD